MTQKARARSMEAALTPKFGTLITTDAASLAAFADLATDFFRADATGNIVFIGESVAKGLGYKPEELVGHNFAEFWMYPERRSELMEELKRTGRYDERETFSRHRDGSPLHVVISARALFDEGGEFTGYVGRLVDRTKGVEIEKNLLESRAHLKAVLDSTNDLIWSVRADNFGLLTFNRPFAEYFLLERGIVVEPGQEPWQLMPEGPYVELWNDYFSRAIRDGSFTTEYVVYAGTRVLRLNMHALKRGDEVFAVSVFGEDITLHKRAQEAHRVSKDRFTKAFHENPIPMVIIETPSLKILEANRALGDLFGYTYEETIGRTAVEIGAQPDPTQFEVNQRRLLVDGSLKRVPATYVTKSGATIHVLMSTEPITWDDNNAAQLVTITDVTELRKLQEEFLQSQKMEAVGRLAGGVAHDFNNLLTVIVGRADWLVTDIEDEALQQQAREILQAGTRASELTEQLLAISRKQTVIPASIRIGHVIQDHERMLRRIVGADITLEVKVEDSLGAVVADQGQVHQILLNLAVNARDAMPHGGTLRLDARNVRIDVDQAANLGTAPGEYVVTSVADTGVGMDEATRRRAFEPFFTTKSAGKGTGLGLPTVKRIVEQGGGTITLESAVGAGTTVSIYLPRVEPTPDAAASGPSIHKMRGTETILVIEDQDDLRSFARSALERFGYTVLDVSSGIRGLDVLHGNQAIDLVVSDVMLTDMRGDEVAGRIRRARPEIPVLFVSGYSEVEPGTDWQLGPREAFLRKPFTMGKLATAIRELLDGGSQD